MTLVAYVDSYNKVSTETVNRKVGRDVFKDARRKLATIGSRLTIRRAVALRRDGWIAIAETLRDCTYRAVVGYNLMNKTSQKMMVSGHDLFEYGVYNDST